MDHLHSLPQAKRYADTSDEHEKAPIWRLDPDAASTLHAGSHIAERNGDAMISTNATPKWTGMVPVDDTALAVTDSGGSGTPVIYLNGQFATQGYWRRVIAELGPDWRHITYDERARGRKSGRSADYSFAAAAVGDVDAVLEARGVDRALVVGWSYGAFVAAHWASRNPDRTIGAVLVDGAQPHDWFTDEMVQSPSRPGMSSHPERRSAARGMSRRRSAPACPRWPNATRTSRFTPKSRAITARSSARTSARSPRRSAASPVEAVWSPCSQSANWPPMPG